MNSALFSGKFQHPSTVEPLYYGHLLDHMKCLIKEDVSLFQRLLSTLLYVAGTTGSVLIREVSLIERFHCIISLMLQPPALKLHHYYIILTIFVRPG